MVSFQIPSTANLFRYPPGVQLSCHKTSSFLSIIKEGRKGARVMRSSITRNDSVYQSTLQFGLASRKVAVYERDSHGSLPHCGCVALH
jgi:hypothetical protein